MNKLIGILTFGLMTVVHAADFTKSNFSYVDLLVWQVREGGADNWAQVISPAGRQQTAHVIDAPFDWNAGVRLGIGHEFDQGNHVVFIFTHYNTTATNQATGIVYSSFLANYFANNTDGANFGPSYSNADIRWQFFYNTADINLGHYFYLDKILQLNPHIGLKAASINQDIYSNWLHPTTTTDFTAATEDLKNDFWGTGPSIGVDTTWPVYRNEQQAVNLLGNITTALVCGHWSFKDNYQNNKPVTINSNVNSVNGLSPMLEGLLGIQWQKHLAKSDISVLVGYEEQIWFNQVQFYSLNMGRVNRSLSLQGGNLEIKYSF